MRPKSLIGKVFRDISPYGRGGEYGFRVRLVRVMAEESANRVICESFWKRGPLAGFPPRRVKILIRTLLTPNRYKELGGQ